MSKEFEVKSVYEEEQIEDEFDMTEIAKNIGCYTPAPKQQKQVLNAADVQQIADKVLDDMDKEDLSKLSDAEVKREFEERLAKEQQEKQKELDKKNGKVKAKAVKGNDRYKASDDALLDDMRVQKLKGKNLHLLKIERDCPRNTVLDILRMMCLEVEDLTKGKKPSDFVETPCFLSVKDWNRDICELADDEYWEVDLKEPYDLTEETRGQIDEDLFPLINLAVHCFSFYRKKSNFIEEDGIWLEKNEHGDWQPMLTYAMSVNKSIRQVMPENVDKLCGFNLMNMFSPKSLRAMKQREEMFTDGERRTFDSIINGFVKQFKDTKPEDLIKEVKRSLVKVPSTLWEQIQLDIDETEVHLMMFIVMVLSRLSEKCTGKTLKDLAKTKSGDEMVDAAFTGMIDAFEAGKELKKAQKNGKSKV